MTNKEAIEEIRSMGLIIDAMTHGTRRKSIYEALNLAIKALKERPQDEWVLITERLPDYMEDTLVTIQVNNREPKVRSGFYAHGYFHNDNGDTWNWNDPEVKAWMSLPEAYKEAKHD